MAKSSEHSNEVSCSGTKAMGADAILDDNLQTCLSDNCTLLVQAALIIIYQWCVVHFNNAGSGYDPRRPRDIGDVVPHADPSSVSTAPERANTFNKLAYRYAAILAGSSPLHWHSMSSLSQSDIETLQSIGNDTIQSIVALFVEAVLWSKFKHYAILLPALTDVYKPYIWSL